MEEEGGREKGKKGGREVPWLALFFPNAYASTKNRGVPRASERMITRPLVRREEEGARRIQNQAQGTWPHPGTLKQEGHSVPFRWVRE